MSRMMKEFWINLRLFLGMTILTGILYPLLITVISQFTMNHQANGSLLIHKGKIIGSTLIAQKFETDRYFWPRPSSIDFNPLPSGGSNLGPTSTALKKAVDQRKLALEAAHFNQPIPSELLFSSGSGLDPHITLEGAYFQIDRIIKARKMDQIKGRILLEKLIDDNTENRDFGFLGSPRVNVLKLNQSLNQLTQ